MKDRHVHRSNQSRSNRGSSSRRSSERSRRDSKSSSSRDPLDYAGIAKMMAQAYCVIMIVVTPWMLGSVSWTSQANLLLAGLVLCPLLLVQVILAIKQGRSINPVPWISWLFVGLACWALIQSLPLFSKNSASSIEPAAVSMQRWALGLTSDLPDRALQLTENFERPDKSIPCDAGAPQSSGKLAWSIEPLHTEGAIGALLLCALMCWCGGQLFSDSKGQLILLLAITAIGVAIACFGFMGAYSYREENFLGLKTGSSFASFRSKNSAGAYLNICLAASMGLVAWTILHLQRKDRDIRYQVSDATILMKIRGIIEDFLSNLNTPQIAAIICMVVITIGVIISQCRGAIVAAAAAVVTTSLLVRSRRYRFGSGLIPILIALATIGGVCAFQLDDDAYARMESLAEFDLEQDAINGRVYIWSVAWEAMRYYGLLGSGLGTFHFAYLPFQHPSSPSWFYHAESLYFQCGVELGFLGLGTMIVVLFFLAHKLQYRIPSEAWKFVTPIRIAFAFLFFSQCIHSSVDFALILPALFLPGCLLVGASLQSISGVHAIIEKSRDQREAANQATVGRQRNISPLTLWSSLALLGFVIVLGFAIRPHLANLAAGEKLALEFREVSDLPFAKRQSGSLNRLLESWPLDSEKLKKNPEALRVLAEAAIQDFRVGLLLKSPATTNWDVSWPVTDPLLLQLGLDREPTPEGQSKILQTAGGNEAIESMNRASAWYSLAHAQSPLDWRLCWGRCRTTLKCSRENMAALVPPVLQLGRHRPRQLVECSLLFRKLLSDNQVDSIWQQAMLTNPASSIQTARMMLSERDIETLDISVFPARTDVLENLATAVFTKDRYPQIHRKLWERAKQYLDRSVLTKARQEIWLANAANALGDLDAEIKHLRLAVGLEPLDFRLACRLAMRLLDIDDLEGAKAIYKKWELGAAGQDELEALRQRLKGIR